MHLLAYWVDTPKQTDEDIFLLHVRRCFAMDKQFETGIQEKNTEQSENPLKPADERRACKDKDTSEDQRTDNSPKEYFMLVFPLHAEE